MVIPLGGFSRLRGNGSIDKDRGAHPPPGAKTGAFLANFVKISKVVFQAVDRIGTTDGSLYEKFRFLRGGSYATEVRLRRLGSHLCPWSPPVCSGPSDRRRYE